MMKMASALSYALSLLVLLMLAFGYSQYAYFTGGPDGYVSDYAAAVRSLYYYFAVPGLLLMGYSLMLGRTARHKPVALRLLAAVLDLMVGTHSSRIRKHFLRMERMALRSSSTHGRREGMCAVAAANRRS